MKNDAKHKVLFISIMINTTIFILLAVLHFYWALGGRLWYDDVLPTSSNGLHKLTPSISAGLAVAFGLLFLAVITAGNKGIFDGFVKRAYFRYGTLMIAIIFLLRAIGDFRFIGFFKMVKLTRFGINDTYFFSPLCLFISLMSLLVFILSKNKPTKSGI